MENEIYSFNVLEYSRYFICSALMFMAHGWLNATGYAAIKGKELNVMFAGAK